MKTRRYGLVVGELMVPGVPAGPPPVPVGTGLAPLPSLGGEEIGLAPTGGWVPLMLAVPSAEGGLATVAVPAAAAVVAVAAGVVVAGAAGAMVGISGKIGPVSVPVTVSVPVISTVGGNVGNGVGVGRAIGGVVSQPLSGSMVELLTR